VDILDTDHVGRHCKQSQVDSETGQPTVAAFYFRFKEGDLPEAYLSVHWLQLLCPDPAPLPEKLQALRDFFAAPHEFPVLKSFKKKDVLTALAVSEIREGLVRVGAGSETRLLCFHAPATGAEEQDSHSALKPDPGSEHWTGKDDPLHLAVSQYLWEKMRLWERLYPVVNDGPAPPRPLT
jgi:hypothetical protein